MQRKPPETDGALYVRLPTDAVERLHRAAEALGIAKKDLVAGLITKHVDPRSKKGLEQLAQISGHAGGHVSGPGSGMAGAGAANTPRRVVIDAGGPTNTVGAYSFQPYDPAPPSEVLTAAQAGELLQIEEELIVELAEAGELPGRKLGKVWRFSRTALVAWLAGGRG
jgi:excisionase family DNA binding protein